MLYERVIPLSSERHRDYCVTTRDRYARARQLNSAPLTTSEFAHAAEDYVIVFAGTAEAVMPAVLLGLRDKENLYVAADGKWTAKHAPAYLRQYPFVFSSNDEGTTFTLCIDEAFPGFNRDNVGERLFDPQGNPTKFTGDTLAFLRDYQAQLRRTRAFCAKLRELGVLEPMRLEVTLGASDQVALGGIMAVSRNRLKTLSPQALSELVRSSDMELVYLQLRSMRNVEALKDRAAAAARPAIGRRRSARLAASEPAGNSTYDADFIFGECGFGWIPDWIDRRLLFNASYDLGSGEIKLYFLDAERSTIFKVSGRTITKQYDAVRFHAPPARLSEFLGTEFDYSDLLLDTVEDDVYYVLLEETSGPQYLKFLGALRKKFAISEERLVEVINRMNKRRVRDLHESHRQRAVSGVKVPFAGANCKLYARPFLTGNSYDLDAAALRFLTRFHGCSAADLPRRIRHLWVGAELLTDRVVITTQHHALVHND